MAAVAIPSTPLPPARAIPQTFSQSFRSWWDTSCDKGVGSSIAERRLFHRLPFLRPEHVNGAPNPVLATSSLVELDKPKHFMNTLSITSTGDKSSAPDPVVILPGYGAGIGFFFANMPTLAQWAGHRASSVYAVDWLGMGRSARVPFVVKSRETATRVREAESFFIDSLESWRLKMKLDKMTLIGHSLGGYLSVAYALKYPERVNKLILLSPAGIAGDGPEVPEREIDPPRTEGAPTAEPATPAKIKKVQADNARAKAAPQSRSRRIFAYLWEEGYSPFQVVRSTLFWAPMLVGKYSSRRFSGLTEDETRDMHDYILHITLSKGSGEYCISHLLAPGPQGVHARMPLVDRMAALKIPVTFIYGDQDWIYSDQSEVAIENMRKAGNGKGRSYIINNAGHHLYLDNPSAVNALLVKELDRRT